MVLGGKLNKHGQIPPSAYSMNRLHPHYSIKNAERQYLIADFAENMQISDINIDTKARSPI